MQSGELRHDLPASRRKRIRASDWEIGDTGPHGSQALHRVLTRPENRYLARHLCWVVTVEGIETYILVPRDSADVQLLIEALRPAPSLMDVDVVIGTRGPIAPPTLCNGLIVPIVVFDQIYSFDVDALMRQIPRPDGVDLSSSGP